MILAYMKFITANIEGYTIRVNKLFLFLIYYDNDHTTLLTMAHNRLNFIFKVRSALNWRVYIAYNLSLPTAQF